MEVGDRLYFVPSQRGLGRRRWITVEKVGRVWLQTSVRHRVHKETLCADGGEYMSPGRCYRTFEEYADQVESNKILQAIHRHMPRGGMPLQDAKRIAQILGLKLSGFRPAEEPDDPF